MRAGRIAPAATARPRPTRTAGRRPSPSPATTSTTADAAERPRTEPGRSTGCPAHRAPSVITVPHHGDDDEHQRQRTNAAVTDLATGCERAELLAALAGLSVLPGDGPCAAPHTSAYSHRCSLPEWTAQKRNRLVADDPLLRLWIGFLTTGT